MKRLLLFSIALLSISISHRIFGQTIHFDTLYADSALGGEFNIVDVDNVSGAFGHPDGSNATVNRGGSFALSCTFGHDPIPFQAGKKVHIWYSRIAPTTDTALVQFVAYRKDLAILHQDTIQKLGEGAPVGTEGVIELTVPADYDGYNALLIATDTSAAAFYIDAMDVEQSGTVDTTASSDVSTTLTESSGFSCYPNPFVASSGTTLHSLLQDASGTYIVMDPLGREVMSVTADRDLHLSLPTAGTYFIRRRIGSDWSGAPQRIVAE